MTAMRGTTVAGKSANVYVDLAMRIEDGEFEQMKRYIVEQTMEGYTLQHFAPYLLPNGELRLAIVMTRVHGG